jgi:4-amino-4-deoxy-L-arabinose transferase-like glycosyltransferase
MVAGLCAAALVFRAVAAARVLIITPDGVTFIEIARHMSDGEFAQALAFLHHPLYPLGTAALGKIFGDFEFSGQAVAVLTSSLAVLPLYFLTRRMAGQAAAVTAALLYAFLPYFTLLGSEVLSEGTFLFFAAWAICLYHRALESGPWWASGLAGACVGFAYLTRPEAVGLVAAFGVYSAAASIHHRQPRPAAHFLLLGGVALAVSFPYLLHIRESTGRWALTQKKVVGLLLSPSANVYRGWCAKFLGDIWQVLHAYVRSGSYVLALLLLPALLRRAKVPRPWARDLFLLLVVGAWAGMGYLLVSSHGYLSRRHLICAALATLPLAAAGLWELVGLARNAGARYRSPEAGRRIGVALVCAFALGLALYSSRAVRLRRPDKLYLVTLGRQIRSMTGPERRIMTNTARLPYYADCREIEFIGTTGVGGVRRLARERKAEFLLIDFEDPHLDEVHPGFREHFDPRSQGPGRRGPPDGFRLTGAWRFRRGEKLVRLSLFEIS